MGQKGRVTVVGSYNVGLFLKGERLPSGGETVIANTFRESGGGKGSNQAIAAFRLGAKVTFVARIGNDKYGKDALELYKSVGLSSKYIKIDPTIHSGISVIFIDRNGQNLISMVPGANFNLSREDIDDAIPAFGDSVIVGFQLENHPEIVAYAIQKAHSMGVKTLLDPAPAMMLPEDLYPLIDFIKPNETEATILTGIEVTDTNSAEKAGQWLVHKGVKTVIITLGSQGALLVTASSSKLFNTPHVEAIDSTGAGDVFSGALMASLSHGHDIEDAVTFANYAAALSVTKLGVIESIPTPEDVNDFFGKHA